MKPLILVTNDDGINSPGLRAAAEAVSDLGDLLIVAPRDQQTSMSRAFSRSADTGEIEEVELGVNGARVLGFAVCGSPAFVVSSAVLGLAHRLPSLCVSGINEGENLGLSVLPSGTVGAALEADSYDIPAVAVSLGAWTQVNPNLKCAAIDWSSAKHITRLIAMAVLARGLGEGTAVLNVNIPLSAKCDTTIRMTRQSRQNYHVFDKRVWRDQDSRIALKLRVEIDMDTLEPDSDIKAFAIDRVVSVTPLTSDLTARSIFRGVPFVQGSSLECR